ncbi:hypothetical protein ABT127_34910 [Streptomyces sp. NPDC001904]
MLLRLEATFDQRQTHDSDPVLPRRTDDIRQLSAVLRFCVAKDVELSFG